MKGHLSAENMPTCLFVLEASGQQHVCDKPTPFDSFRQYSQRLLYAMVLRLTRYMLMHTQMRTDVLVKQCVEHCICALQRHTSVVLKHCMLSAAVVHCRDMPVWS